MSDHPSDGPGPEGPVPERSVSEGTGAGLVRFDDVGTVIFVAVAVAAAVAPDGLAVAAAIVSGLLFVVGVALFLWGFARGVMRSQREVVTMGGLFFLSHTAPRPVRRRLRLMLGIQVAVSVTAALARPDTALAFAVLAPFFGLGTLAAWGARYGTFYADGEQS